MTWQPKCDFGAAYDSYARPPKIVRVCDQIATHQLLMDGEHLLMVLCTDHALDWPPSIITHPKITLEEIQ